MSAWDLVSLRILVAFCASFYMSWRASFTTILVLVVIGAVVCFVGDAAIHDAVHLHEWALLPAKTADAVRTAGGAIAAGALVSLMAALLTHNN